MRTARSSISNSPPRTHGPLSRYPCPQFPEIIPNHQFHHHLPPLHSKVSSLKPQRYSKAVKIAHPITKAAPSGKRHPNRSLARRGRCRSLARRGRCPIAVVLTGAERFDLRHAGENRRLGRAKKKKEADRCSFCSDSSAVGADSGSVSVAEPRRCYVVNRTLGAVLPVPLL
jgi:hypothetical protein